MKSVNTLGIVNHLHLAVIQTSHLRLIHDNLLIKIKVPPLSVYEIYVCNTVRELCQLRYNLYSCDIYIDITDITAMLNEVCTE